MNGLRHLYAFTMFGIVWCTCIASAHAQSYDWGALFQEVVSDDENVRSAARERAFDTIIPKLSIESAAALDADVVEIVKFLDSSPEIRMQASAMLAGLSMIRSDDALSP